MPFFPATAVSPTRCWWGPIEKEGNMSTLVDQEVAGSRAHRWPHGGTSGERPRQEDAQDVTGEGAKEAVPLALALVPAKGVE